MKQDLPRGDSLAFLLEGGALPEKDALTLFALLCDEVAAVHETGKVHRAIDPEHVYIWGTQVTLAESEKSEACGEKGGSAAAASSGFPSVSGTEALKLGIQGGIPPEQYTSRGAAVTDDIYALGVLLNRMLTGKHPSEQPARGPAGRIVARCTRMNPKRRYQSISELKAALDRMKGQRIPAGPVAAGMCVLICLLFFLLPRTFEGDGSVQYTLRGKEYLLKVNDGAAEVILEDVSEQGFRRYFLFLRLLGENGEKVEAGARTSFVEAIRDIHVTAEVLDENAQIFFHTLSTEPSDDSLYGVIVNSYSASNGKIRLNWHIQMKNGDKLVIRQTIEEV